MTTISAMLLSSVATFVAAAGASSPEHAAFHEYMSRYGRPYERDSEEYHRRAALFFQRSAAVRQQNAKPDRLWTATVNHLTDRTEGELQALRGWFGVKGGASSSSAAPAKATVRTFLSQRGRGRPLPMEVNWTSLNSARQIRDQGGCGSCWAVTSAAVLEQHMEIYNPEKYRSFSAQELVSCVPNPHKCGGDGGCSGATVELAFHWAMNKGLASEKETPYSASDGSCKKSSKEGLLQMAGHELSLKDLTTPGVHVAPAEAGGRAFGMFGWERLPENGYEALLRALQERGPVAISVSASAWSAYGTGVFDSCSRDATIDHAVVLVGYGKDKALGKLYYLIQNSWGADWGEEGHIRILRRENDQENCGTDYQPEVGTACKGGPSSVKVCGMCGILYDSAVPHFQKLGA